MVFDAPTPAPAAAVIRDHLQRIHRRYGKELPGGARFEIRAIWPDKERSTVPRTFPATEAGFEAATEHAVDMNGQGTNIYVTVNALRPDMPEHKGAKDADIIAGIFQFADFDDSYGAGNARAMRALSLDTFSVITGTIPHERLHLYFERSEPCTDMEE